MKTLVLSKSAPPSSGKENLKIYLKSEMKVQHLYIQSLKELEVK